MLNALPMGIFGPVSLFYWIFYSIFDPILEILGLNEPNSPQQQQYQNGHVKTPA